MSQVKLNKQQKKAVNHKDGPLLIIAGAGTGKTTVITQRIVSLVTERNINPQEILALTFTEKASKEMQERVDLALPLGYSEMWTMTFHSFCDRILKESALHIGLDPRFKLMSEPESIRFFRKNLFDFELSYFRPLGNPHKFISGILNHFSRLKDEDISPDQYLKWVTSISQTKAISSESQLEYQKWSELASCYQKYEDLKIKNSVMDYADLISHTLNLFRERPNVLKTYTDKFKYILVDEFQDTNIAQNELIKLLSQKSGNVTVVADDDQSIYKWRGAAISNVLQFRNTFPDVEIVVLTENYRSTQSILDSSYKLIQNNNPDRLETKEGINKKLIAFSNKKGSLPEFIYATRVEDEADLVVQKITELIKKENRNYSDFAILVRANNHADPFTRALERRGLPFQFLGPGKLFKQPEIKDLIAYLKLLANLEDSAAVYKVLTMDLWNIPPRDLSAITSYAKKVNLNLYEALEKVDDIFVAQTTKELVNTLVAMIRDHLRRVPKESAGQILYYFLQDSGYLKMLSRGDTPEIERQSENISKFFDKLKTYEVDNDDSSIFAVIDWIDLAIELGESPLAADTDWNEVNAVNILTVHSSKGLEFPVVFIVNLVAQRFPTTERHEQIPIPDELIKEIPSSGNYHLQEERRLFYVALTRAKEKVYLTAANYYGEGKREKKLSPFISETLGLEILTTKPDPMIKNSEQLSIIDFYLRPDENLENIKNKEQQILKIKENEEIRYLSYSQLETFRFCPLHYKLRYILKIPTPSTAALSFGNTLHIALKDFNLKVMAGEKVTKDDLFKIYKDVWIREGYENKSHELQMQERGNQYLETYLNSSLHDITNPPLQIEEPFIFPVEDFKVGGKIDRVNKTDKGIEIIDYKTTDFSSKELPTEKDLAKDLQMSVYALAANKVLGKNPENVTLSLYFLDKGKKVSTTRTQEELEKATKDIIGIREEIQSSDFLCSGNFWCKNCEYKLFCEERS